MKRWQCTVCGYIHEGNEPPDECPVCGADRSAFMELPAEAAAAASAPAGSAKWQCTVCGYHHEGVEPPGECPVCGAERSQFVILPAAEHPGQASSPQPGKDPDRESSPTAAPTSSTSGWRSAYAVFLGLAFRYHFHPIAVHVPNGVVPISVLFVLLGALIGSDRLGAAAAYNTIFVCLFMPVVLWSGYLHWKHRFKGALTRLFLIKIGCGTCLQVLALVCSLWFLTNPEIALHPPLMYLLCHLGMLAAGTVAGYFGGRLVFHRYST